MGDVQGALEQGLEGHLVPCQEFAEVESNLSAIPKVIIPADEIDPLEDR